MLAPNYCSACASLVDGHGMSTTRTWLTMEQSAALLGCSIRTVERALKRGEYQVELVNGRRMLDMTLEAQQRDGTAQALRDAGVAAAEQASALARTVQWLHEQQAALQQEHQQALAGMQGALDAVREQVNLGQARERALAQRGLRRGLMCAALVAVACGAAAAWWRADVQGEAAAAQVAALQAAVAAAEDGRQAAQQSMQEAQERLRAAQAERERVAQAASWRVPLALPSR